MNILDTFFYIFNFSIYSILSNATFIGVSIFEDLDKSEVMTIFGGIEYVLLIYIFHLFLLFLGRYFYDKLKEKKKDYGDIYFLAFVLRIFPILSLIASFLLGMNNEKLSKVIKVFTSGFVLYTIIGYLIFKYFGITWMSIFGLF